LNAAEGNAAQPRAVADDEDFDFVKSVGETGYRIEAQEESFEDASDSAFGQETETLLVGMRKAITEQGLTGSEYNAPDLLRFLRARSNNVMKASKLFVDHEKWRARFCPKGYISEDEVRNELDAKKACLQGKDKLGQPFAVSLVKNHYASKRDPEEFKRILVYAIDKYVALMPPGIEKFVALLDLTGIGYSNLDSSALRHIFDFLQGYYPERLGTLFILNAPFIFGAVWKVVSPFIDSRTRKKIVFCTSKNVQELLMTHLDPDQVPTEYGGTAPLIYIQDYHVPGYPPDEEKLAKKANGNSSGPEHS
jgi:hypothetical protein